jgi:hypothetical protein
MHFFIQHNEIIKTHVLRFSPQKKSFYLQASVINEKGNEYERCGLNWDKLWKPSYSIFMQYLRDTLIK